MGDRRLTEPDSRLERPSTRRLEVPLLCGEGPGGSGRRSLAKEIIAIAVSVAVSIAVLLEVSVSVSVAVPITDLVPRGICG